MQNIKYQTLQTFYINIRNAYHSFNRIFLGLLDTMRPFFAKNSWILYQPVAKREKSFNLHRPPFFSSFEFRRYSDFCPDRATMATIFSPPTGSPALPGEKLGANKESSLRPLGREKGQKGEKGRYTNKRCAGWIIREKRPRNVNSHCGEPSPTPSIPIGDRSMYRVNLRKPNQISRFRWYI